MNFKRIQWNFIIAFVLLDIGLCVSLLMGTQFHNTGKQQSQTQITLKEMKNDLISVGPLSDKRRNGYYTAAQSNNAWTSNNRVNQLRGQTARFNDGIVNSTFQKNIKLRTGASQQQQLDKVVHSNLILHGKQYSYNEELSTAKQIVYTQTIKDQPVLDREGQIKFHVNNNHEVTGYTQGYLSEFKILRPRAMTISQQQAVTWLYRHNQINNNSQITHVIFGYSKIQKNGNQVVFVPIWTVNVKNKAGGSAQSLRVNAFSGTLFKMSTNN